MPTETTVVCPHCGDRTSQDVLLPSFTCGACDEPFAPSQTTDHPDLDLNCAICGAHEAIPLFEGRTYMMLCEECLNAAFVSRGCNGNAENE